MPKTLSLEPVQVKLEMAGTDSFHQSFTSICGYEDVSFVSFHETVLIKAGLTKNLESPRSHACTAL